MTEPSHTLPRYTLPPRRSAVNWRSLLLGLLGVIFICGLTPFNDNAMENTILIGTYMPVGLLLFFLVLVLLVNAPLSRFLPRLALNFGEMGVILGMVLVSCALPSSGLMTFLPASIVGMHQQAAVNNDYRKLLEIADLPNWILPDFKSKDPGQRGDEDVIRYYYSRTPREEEGWKARILAVPWKLWRTPAIGWALLLVPMFGSYLFLSTILRRQWVENERLPFPIAQIYLRLIEPPPAHRWFNGLFASRMFWIAAVSVLLVHSTNALSLYFPRYVPAIPLGFNFYTLMSEGLVSFTYYTFKNATLSFSIVAIAFFLQSKVSFSLWGFFVIWQIVRMGYGVYQSDFPEGSRFDQMTGSMYVFVLLVLWIGRQHWALVFRHMVGRARRHDPQDPYVPYALAGWGLFACLLGMGLWLLAVGTTLAGAVLLVTIQLTLMIAISRVVAESGLIYAQIHSPYQKPYLYLADLFNFRTTPKNFFHAGWWYQIFGHDTRESLPVFAMHALRIADGAHGDEEAQPRRRWPFMVSLVLALGVGYLVSGASTLLVEYNYAEPMHVGSQPPINPWGIDGSLKYCTLDPATQYVVGNNTGRENYSRVGHFAFSVILTAFLAFMRLNFTWWPLHPIGYLLCFSDPIGRVWFSLFIGWLAKVLIVRFGGASLFKKAQPLFIGLLLGEAAASALWLVISLVLALLGLPYYPMRFTSA